MLADYEAGQHTPPCAWCGLAADGRMMIEPAKVTKRHGRPHVIAAAVEVPVCEICRPALIRDHPERRKAKAQARSQLWNRYQDVLF